jgi:hypothetical protein
MILYPGEVSPPIQSNKCYGGDGLETKIDCTIVQNIITTTDLPLRKQDSTTTSIFLDVGAKLSFTIKDSLNPKSGAPTSIYKFYIKDNRGNVKAEMTHVTTNNDMML